MAQGAKKKTAAKKKTTKKAVKKTTAKAVTKKTTAKKSTKKTTTKKATVKKSVADSASTETKTALKRRRKAKKHLTKKELEHFADLLLTKRAELLGDVAQMEDSALRKNEDASSDLSSMPIHMADLGTDNFEQEFALGLVDSERKLLNEITDALIRIQDGEYGICEGTDKQIGKPRLEAKPWARYCIEYARMVEKGLVREGERILDEDNQDDEDDIDLLEEKASFGIEEFLPGEDNDIDYVAEDDMN